jgi:hypothetical protein
MQDVRMRLLGPASGNNPVAVAVAGAVGLVWGSVAVLPLRVVRCGRRRGQS